MSISIFLNSFLQLHRVNSYENFSSRFHLSFLWNYFEIKSFVQLFWDCFVWFWPLLPFFSNAVIGMTLKATQWICCYISEVLTEHMFKNLHEFYYFIVFYIANFTMMNEKNDYSLQECSIITLQTKVLLIFTNSNATACYLIFPWKLRDLK